MKITFTLLCSVLWGVTNCNPLTSNDVANGTVEEIRSNLYVKQATGSPILLDGDLTQYDPSYSNAVDGKDARKMSNFSENIGMVRGATVLVIERRQTITIGDTIFFKLWQLHQLSYQLQFITNNLDHPGLEGFLEDNYLQTSTPIDLNGATTADFSVTSDAASANSLRFRIVFKTVASGPLPLTFTSLKAFRDKNDIHINWVTENENHAKNYSVEKSTDGKAFTEASDVKAANLPQNNYSWVDKNVANNRYYYRILIADIDGKVKYSPVMKVDAGTLSERVKVYPNPVTNQRIHFQIAEQPAGLYRVKLVSGFGQVILSQTTRHNGGTFTGSIQPGQKIEKGIYQIEITSPSNTIITEKVIL